MYYTAIKHSDHLRTLDKCRKHSPAARVFYISLVFSNARRVLSQCNTRLRLLYLLSKKTRQPKLLAKYVIIIANEPAERRRSAGEAAENSAARRMAYSNAKKFSIEL